LSKSALATDLLASSSLVTSRNSFNGFDISIFAWEAISETEFKTWPSGGVSNAEQSVQIVAADPIGTPRRSKISAAWLPGDGTTERGLA
jgi:hypothetical protein